MQTVSAFKYQKVGGIRFLRLARLQFSFCLCRKATATTHRATPVATIPATPRIVSAMVDGQRCLIVAEG